MKNPERKGILSHAERLAKPQVSYPKTLHSDYEVRGVEQVVVNGRIVNKSVAKSVHPQDNFKGVKVLDFALENVIAAGALDSLREGRLPDSTLYAADSVDASVSRMNDALDAAIAENVSNNAVDNGGE